MLKKMTVLTLAVALMLFASVSASAAEQKPAAQEWEAAVGLKVSDKVVLNNMFPKVLFIHEGDTVNFVNKDAADPHTATFLAGQPFPQEPTPELFAPSTESGSEWDGTTMINSGFMVPGQSYKITFTKAGAYPYVCLLHPNMTGTIVVLPAGQPLPTAQEQAAAADLELEKMKEQAELVAAAHHKTQAEKNMDGTTTYHVETSAAQDFLLNQMLPGSLVISEGDSVQWNMHNPHAFRIITFNKPANTQLIVDTPQGPNLNPVLAEPKGGPSFDGKGYVTSGPMMGAYKLQFTKAGTYTYEDAVYGSKGTITVLPKDAVKVIVNGKALTYEGKLPHKHNGIVFAAVAPFVQALGGKVELNTKLNAVVVSVGGKFELPTKLVKTSGLNLIINGKQLITAINPAPHQHDGRTYASVQEMVSLLGGQYSWDEATQTLTVTLNTLQKQAATNEHANH